MTSSSSSVRGTVRSPLALELPAHRPGLGHATPVLGEQVAHLGPGAVAVVGQASRRSRPRRPGRSPRRRSTRSGRPRARPMPRLMARSMVSMGTEASRAFVYMVRRLALAVMSLAALAGGHLHLTDELGEHLGPGRVLGALAVLGGRPFGVSRHRLSPLLFRVYRPRTARCSLRSPVSSGWNAAVSTDPCRQITGCRQSGRRPHRPDRPARSAAWPGPPPRRRRARPPAPG